jgi:mono/diheme cytochrome c family protein
MHRIALPVMALVLTIIPPGATAADGEQAFKDRCAKCHTARSMRAVVARKPLADRAAELDRFLVAHYAPDPAERAAIVQYLLPRQP